MIVKIDKRHYLVMIFLRVKRAKQLMKLFPALLEKILCETPAHQ